MHISDALIGVVVGALLTLLTGQLGQWLASRRDEKKAIARALSDLLEIRHRLLAVPKITEHLVKHFPIPPEGQTAIKIAFTRLFPADVDIGKRYGEAVTLVSASDPILGFRLRSQNVVSPLLDTVRQLALADGPAAAGVLSSVETELMGHLKPHFDELITELAWLHSWLTWWKVRRRLKRPMELPEGILQSLTTQITQLTQVQPNAAKPAVPAPDLVMPAGFPVSTLEAIRSRVVPRLKTPSPELEHFVGASSGTLFRTRACADYGAAFTQSVGKFGDTPPVEERYKQETFLFAFIVSGTAALDSLSMLIYAAAAQIVPAEFPMQKPGQIKRINCKTTAEMFHRVFPNETLTTALKELVNDPRFEEWDTYRNVLAHRAAPGRHISVSFGSPVPDPAAGWKIDPNGAVTIDVNLAPPRLAWLIARLAALLAAADEFTQKRF